MASLGRAVSQVVNADFAMDVGLVVVGTLAGQFVTNFARDNVVDIGMAGGDLVYAAVGALLTKAALPNRFAHPLSLGMMATATMTAARERGLV